MTLRFALLMLCVPALCPLSACAHPQASALSDPERAFDSQIMIGRLEMMAEQSATALARLSDSADTERMFTSARLYSRLYAAVWLNNDRWTVACDDNIAEARLCRDGIYAPNWLIPPHRARYSLAEVHRFAEEAQSAIGEQWAFLCDKADPSAARRPEDLPLCNME